MPTDPETNPPLRRAAGRAKLDPEIAALYKRIGSRIGELQDDRGLSQREACIGVFGSPAMQSEWSRWRRGVQLPNIATLHRIAKYFGVSLGALGLFEPKETLSEMELEQAREHVASLAELLK